MAKNGYQPIFVYTFRQGGKMAIVTVFTNGEVASQKNVYQSFSKNALLLGLFLSFISFE